MTYKVETARFNFVSEGAEPKMAEDGLPIVQGVRWQEYLEHVLNAQGQFIELRRLEEYEELTVAYPIPGNASAPPPARPAQPTGWDPYPDENMAQHISKGEAIRAAPASDDLDSLINGDTRIL